MTPTPEQNGMASLLCTQSKFDEAERFLRAALSAVEAACGPDSYEVAAASAELADLLATLGRAEEATAMYRTVLRIKRDLLGPRHSEVLETVHNLALLLDGAGQSDEAQSLWTEARAALAARQPSDRGRQS
jgi:tetratricopeptide (TPR) repeat protein